MLCPKVYFTADIKMFQPPVFTASHHFQGSAVPVVSGRQSSDVLQSQPWSCPPGGCRPRITPPCRTLLWCPQGLRADGCASWRPRRSAVATPFYCGARRKCCVRRRPMLQASQGPMLWGHIGYFLCRDSNFSKMHNLQIIWSRLFVTV
jgi:hypothetical protein